MGTGSLALVPSRLASRCRRKVLSSFLRLLSPVLWQPQTATAAAASATSK